MGRRKIKIERIADKHDRFICFSKRRTGLFNKANELALRGFQVAVLVFSRSGNAFVYGSPNAEAVVDRFLHNSGATNGAGSSNTAKNMTRPLEDCRAETGKVLSAERRDMSRDETDLASETAETLGENHIMYKEEGWESLNSALTESERFWWNSSAEDLSWENLLQFKSALEELLDSVRRKADSLLVEKDFLAGFT